MKKVNLPDETVEKLIKNEFEMNVDNETVKDEEVTETEKDFKLEETEDEEVTETEVVDYNEVDYASRGFKSLDDAILFMETPYFKGLGEADKNEYRNWLIKK